jgi:hypothetical protein
MSEKTTPTSNQSLGDELARELSAAFSRRRLTDRIMPGTRSAREAAAFEAAREKKADDIFERAEKAGLPVGWARAGDREELWRHPLTCSVLVGWAVDAAWSGTRRGERQWQGVCQAWGPKEGPKPGKTPALLSIFIDQEPGSKTPQGADFGKKRRVAKKAIRAWMAVGGAVDAAADGDTLTPLARSLAMTDAEPFEACAFELLEAGAPAEWSGPRRQGLFALATATLASAALWEALIAKGMRASFETDSGRETYWRLANDRGAAFAAKVARLWAEKQRMTPERVARAASKASADGEAWGELLSESAARAQATEIEKAAVAAAAKKAAKPGAEPAPEKRKLRL